MNENLVCAITGASGYVGSRIARRLAQNARVVALTRKPSAATDIPWALDSADDIAPLLRQWRVSVLIHAAWDFSAVSSEDIQRVNVEGSIRLLRMAKAAGVGRIVFISTISAFTGARSLYGKAKLQVESVVAELGGIILRPGLVFGDSPGGVFGSIRKQVQHQKFIPLIGNGKAPQFLVPEETLAEVVADAAAATSIALPASPSPSPTLTPGLFAISSPTWPSRRAAKSRSSRCPGRCSTPDSAPVKSWAEKCLSVATASSALSIRIPLPTLPSSKPLESPCLPGPDECLANPTAFCKSFIFSVERGWYSQSGKLPLASRGCCSPLCGKNHSARRAFSSAATNPG